MAEPKKEEPKKDAPKPPAMPAGKKKSKAPPLSKIKGLGAK